MTFNALSDSTFKFIKKFLIYFFTIKLLLNYIFTLSQWDLMLFQWEKF